MRIKMYQLQECIILICERVEYTRRTIMNRNKIRNIIGMALLAGSLFVGSVAPVSAAPNTQIANPNPGLLQCYYNGNYYPIGTKLAAGPYFYRQCEWGWVVDSFGIPHYQPVWKIYPRT